MDNKPKVAFVCVHNSCRSQIAEALGRHFAGEVFDSYSAGTKINKTINEDAVRLIREIYSIDLEKTQRPKLLEELPQVDLVIKMGCEVVCPYLPARYIEDWGIEDPTGKGDLKFREVIATIEVKIKELSEKVKAMDLRPQSQVAGEHNQPGNQKS